MAASLCETLDGGDGVSSHVWQMRQVCSPGTEDSQGRGNSAGLKGRGEEMHRSEEGKQPFHWVRDGGPACRRELLGQRWSSGNHVVYSEDGEPIGPYNDRCN